MSLYIISLLQLLPNRFLVPIRSTHDTRRWHFEIDESPVNREAMTERSRSSRNDHKSRCQWVERSTERSRIKRRELRRNSRISLLNSIRASGTELAWVGRELAVEWSIGGESFAPRSSELLNEAERAFINLNYNGLNSASGGLRSSFDAGCDLFPDLRQSMANFVGDPAT